MSTNARFDQGHIERGPVSYTAGPLSNTHPRCVISYRMLSGINQFLVCNLDGTIKTWSPGSTETDISISGYTPSSYDQPYTGCISNNLVFVNRSDRTPWYMSKDGSVFATLPIWPTTWRAEALRSFNGQIIALNVTQGANHYPTMIAWSDFTVWNSYPQYWTASSTNSAGSNVLSDLGDPLVDGLTLRNTFILYSSRETWAMTATGDTSVFSFQRLFDTNFGAISQNCVVEVNNTHFVFGLDQIWKHDGFTPVDISSARVKDFVYENMDKANANQFFVVNHPRNGEVIFCYRSTDAFCAFPINGVTNYQGCNRAAVYNYRGDTWYFYDLPYVTSAGWSGTQPTATYATEMTTSYASIGGSYSSYGDASKLCLYTVSNAAGAISSSVRSFELPNSVFTSGIVDTAATPSVNLYISEINLDTLGAALRGYKVVKSVYPQGRIDAGATPLIFNFGASDYPNTPTHTLGSPMSFDGSTLYKLDFMTAGRFLSMQVTFNDYRNFSISGLDVDFEVTGNR